MLLYALVFAAATTDTIPSADSTRLPAAPSAALATPLLSAGDAAPRLRSALDVTSDTTPRRPRPKAIEYSDWYEKRLAIHKAASWAMLPLFVGQYYTGSTLVAEGTDSPTWVKRVHPVLATGVLALFATNTVTGVWNLWEGRAEPKGRSWRFAHSILMLASDAGFAYVGQLSKDAKVSGSARDRHRTAAIVSGSMAMASYVMMLSPFRRDQ